MSVPFDQPGECDMISIPKIGQVALVIWAAFHILTIELILNTRAYLVVPVELTLRLDRVFSTGTAGLADMMVLFLVGSVFYLGYLLLLRRFEEPGSSKISLAVLVFASVLLNVLLIIRVRIGGDVVRNITFAAAFLRGYNPYSITGYELNQLIQTGKVSAPLVAGYLDHRFDYPPITLLYYSVVLFLASDFLRAYVLTEIGLTTMRFAGSFLIYRICRLQGISYLLPVGLFLMNPLMIYSSYDGKEEALLVVLSLLSIYLFSLRKTSMSGIALALSTLTKYVTVLYWPILALYERKIRQSLLLSLGYVATILAISGPFLVGSPFVFSFVFWQMSRPCNSLLNIFCYDAANPFSIARFVAGLAYLSIFAVLAISVRSERGFSRMTGMLTAATIIAVIFARSFFIWYLDWFSISIYFAQKKATFSYILPLILPLVAVPSLFG
jgi:hypothetical protein